MKKLLCVLLFILSGSVQLRSQNPNTAKFPGAIVADADIGVAKNRARAQLSGSINDTDLTISVDNGAAFASPSWASVDTEFLKICAIAANTLTVCTGGRGAFGSTAASHQAGAWISGPLLDQHVNQLAAEVKAIETALGINLVNVPQYWSKSGDDLSYTSGKVGIGASSPGPLFYLYSAGDTSMAVEKNGGMAASLGAGTFASVFQYDNSGNFGIYADTRAHIRGGVLGGTPALMATSTGNILVGTDTDDSSGAKLQVNGSVKATSFTGPLTGNVTGNVSGNAGTVTNGVYGGSNLTSTGRAVYTSAAGTLSQSSATLNSAGQIQIPSGQGLQLLSGGANMTFQSGLSGAVLWGDASSAGWFSLGPANSNDSTVSFKYARGTIGGQAGVLHIGQLGKTNANWTHEATAFYSLGAERARVNNNGLVVTGSLETSNGTAGDRTLWKQTSNGILRWIVGLHGDESGSNAGSAVSFWRYDDAGNYLGAPFQIRRNTGNILLNTDTDNGADLLQVNGSASFLKPLAVGGLARDTFPALLSGAYSGTGLFTDGNVADTTLSRTDASAATWSLSVGDYHNYNLALATDVVDQNYPDFITDWSSAYTDPASAKLWRQARIVGRKADVKAGVNAAGSAPDSVIGDWRTVDYTSNDAATNNGRLHGSYLDIGKRGSGHSVEINGFYSIASTYDTSTVDSLALFRGGGFIDGTSITNLYGVAVDTPYKGKTTITNAYGQYLSDWSALSTNGYNFYSAGASSKNKMEGSLEVGGGITGNVTSGAFTAKGRFGAVETSVPRVDMVFNAHPSGANWVRDDDTKSAAILTSFDSYTDIYTTAPGAGNIDWILGLRVYHATGAVYMPTTPRQLNFTLYDPNVALAAATIPGIWRAALGGATVTAVACMADTVDGVIQIKKNTSTSVLSADLTCGNGTWAGAAGISNPSLSLGDDLGIQVISGTAKRINVTINYTQQ